MARAGHPRRVLPFVSRVVPHARRRFRRQFAIERVGVGLQLLVSREARPHVVLVRSALGEPGHEELPDAAVAPPHGVAARVPIVELAGQRDGLGIRRPHREAHAGDAVAHDDVRAQRQPAFVERAFGVQVKIGFGNLRTEAVGVVDLHLAPIPQARAQFIGAGVAVQRGHEEALRVLLHHLATSAAHYHRRRVGVREKRADFPARLPASSCGPNAAPGCRTHPRDSH